MEKEIPEHGVVVALFQSKVQGQLDRICKVNATLRQTNNFCANQTKRLMEERLELEVQLKEKENSIHQLKERIGNGQANTDSPTVSRIVSVDRERRSSNDRCSLPRTI